MAASDVRAVQSTYELILWMVPQLAKFPREQRFLLGDRIQTTLLALLEGLIEAAYSRQKGALLDGANLDIEKLRFLVRLARDLGFLPTKSYRFAAEKLDELGAQVGGWRKAASRAARG